MRRSCPARQSGFTLLEVLIAFIIAALAIGALLRGAAGGLHNAATAAHYQDALSRARSRLAEAALALVPGDSRGDDGGGFTWQASIRPVATGAPPRPGVDPILIGRPVLYAVTVSIAWRMDGGTRSVQLSTRRLGTAAPVAPGAATPP